MKRFLQACAISIALIPAGAMAADKHDRTGPSHFVSKGFTIERGANCIAGGQMPEEQRGQRLEYRMPSAASRELWSCTRFRFVW